MHGRWGRQCSTSYQLDLGHVCAEVVAGGLRMVISGQVLWMKGYWVALAAQNRRVGSLLDAGEARAVQGLLLTTRVRS